MALKSCDKLNEIPLTSTMEDYLEAIFDLDQEKKFVRVMPSPEWDVHRRRYRH